MANALVFKFSSSCGVQCRNEKSLDLTYDTFSNFKLNINKKIYIGNGEEFNKSW